MGELRRYRKKPVVVEAVQWFKNGDHPEDRVGEIEHDPVSGDYRRHEGAVVRYFRRPDGEFAGDATHPACGATWHDHGWIDTLEGGHTVCPGDFIITGVAGERYPCKPQIFADTYDPEDPEEDLYQATEAMRDHLEAAQDGGLVGS